MQMGSYICYHRRMNDLKREVLDSQLAASDPRYNVWVNASAGSGKTKVLIDRILRLLLAGVEPSSILCITFTKAAALEMHERLQLHLERWILATDLELKSLLNAVDPDLQLSSNLLYRARALYNLVLDSSVKIQTIHAFSQQILQGGAGELEAPFGVELGHEIVTQRLAHQTASEILSSKYQDVPTEIYQLFSRSKFNDVVQAILQDRGFFRFVLMEGVEAFKTRLTTYLKEPRDEVAIDSVFQAYCEAVKINFDCLLCSDAGSDKDREFLNALKHAIQTQNLSAVLPLVLTAQGTLRKRLLSKKLSDLFSFDTNLLIEFASFVYELDQEKKRCHTLRSSVAVITFAEHFLKVYAQKKNNAGVMDYDDLIFRALELLSTPETAEAVLYRIDCRLNHVLIDEAQDTNLYQWKLMDGVVSNLLQSEDHTSVFVVGDHKQSIFGFQGTDPDIFHSIKEFYCSKPATREWKSIGLNISFRSLQGVLDKVDHIFQSSALIQTYSEHVAFRGEGGNCTLYPLVDGSEHEDGIEVFADQVVGVITNLIGSKRNYGGRVVTVNAEDILILIRRRGEHLDAIQAALREKGIRFSAPNRQMIYDDCFVDLIIRFMVVLLQPLDRANILHMLLNPLFPDMGCPYQLAERHVGEDRALLREVLDYPFVSKAVEAADGYVSLEDLYQRLMVLIEAELKVDAHCVANALVQLDALRNLVWKLGDEAIHTEILNDVVALGLQQGAVIEKGSVRILTVHGAKGLQAPIVLLVDTTQTPTTREVMMQDAEKSVLLCASGRESEPSEYLALKTEHKESELKEYYRLLYVAMTRAENELHIFGYSSRKVSTSSWYALYSASEKCAD